MMKSKVIFCATCLLASYALAADSLYSQAQKLYSQGDFETAAKTYAQACPQLEAKEKKICQLNEVRALIESYKLDLAQAAEPKLLTLISQTEPSDSLFSKLSMEDAKLQVLLDNPVRAVRSWKAAQTSASPDYFPELFVLCSDIVEAYPKSELTAENCDRIKPSDTTLISLPRKKTTKLSTQSSQQPPIQSSQPPTLGQWYIQLGAFGSRENADRLVTTFKSKDVQLHVVELTDRKLFAVRTGLFATSNDAKTYAEQKIAPSHKDYKIFSAF